MIVVPGGVAALESDKFADQPKALLQVRLDENFPDAEAFGLVHARLHCLLRRAFPALGAGGWNHEIDESAPPPKASKRAELVCGGWTAAATFRPTVVQGDVVNLLGRTRGGDRP